MRWPWVSRRAFEIAEQEHERLTIHLTQEIDWLREENEKLREHGKRMDRVDRGLGEVPRPPKPPLEEMPKHVHELIMRYGDPRTQLMLKRDAYRAHHTRGEPWDAIYRRMKDTQDAESTTE